ncbi:MAG: hypothetical protein C4520_10705 [Candidatus Abyssobacteria bacterium SURF_5]|uniref:HAD family hydrolase n=1 Tax=Abyssobacteria bacterium (strain SURF_5) TaxID=2093360 RepID=A0A3A4NQQ7_ABYX5|nr:MAG: hypothetical protein C4520_10705 [Candidatus Abyssubacteria bacterium SURF_5]
MRTRKYKAIVSSDWNGCLAPGGPFDCISFHYPSLTPALTGIFKEYTSNRITFQDALERLQELMPSPIDEGQMDAYIDSGFKTYAGVPELIERLLSKDILFMINTTGPQGYFQRLFSKGLLPQIPAFSASPFIRYPRRKSDPALVYDLFDTSDKPKNTAKAMHAHDISARKVILIGDSGGDGPHFEWGNRVGAFLIASMTKESLRNYCADRGITIRLHFGLSYPEAEEADLEKEMQVDFMELEAVFEEVCQ